MEQRWCLGNRKTSKVEKNLYPNQVAQRVVDHLREGYDELDWVVWTTGWPAWKPLTEIEELVHEIGLLKKIAEDSPPPLLMSIPPPPPPMEIIQAEEEKIQAGKKQWEARKPETITPIQSPVTLPNAPAPQPVVILTSEPVASLSQSTELNPTNPYANKRKHKRIEARFRCIIRSTTLTFRTFTKDISLGGVALEDEIPMELVGTECTIYIMSSKGNKNLRFKIAMTGRSVAKYFSFKEADDPLIQELSLWLDEQEQLLVA